MLVSDKSSKNSTKLGCIDASKFKTEWGLEVRMILASDRMFLDKIRNNSSDGRYFLCASTFEETVKLDTSKLDWSVQHNSYFALVGQDPVQCFVRFVFTKHKVA